jgi:hypothetical protein
VRAHTHGYAFIYLQMAGATFIQNTTSIPTYPLSKTLVRQPDPWTKVQMCLLSRQISLLLLDNLIRFVSTLGYHCFFRHLIGSQSSKCPLSCFIVFRHVFAKRTSLVSLESCLPWLSLRLLYIDHISDTFLRFLLFHRGFSDLNGTLYHGHD